MTASEVGSPAGAAVGCTEGAGSGSFSERCAFSAGDGDSDIRLVQLSMIFAATTPMCVTLSRK